MKVVIHIGTEKTGTSSIQAFLVQNKCELAKQGFFYLHTNGRNEYRDFPAYCLEQDQIDDYFRHNRVTDEKARKKFDEDFLSRYKQSIESIPESIHTVVISSEHFSSRLKSIEEVCRAKELLEQYFSSVQIICYLRDQVAKICSSYSTVVKSGQLVTFDEFFNSQIDLHKTRVNEYDRKLALWEKAFGVENIDVRIFTRANFAGGTLLSDFCSALDESLFDGLHALAQRQNEALSRRGCELMRRVNYLFPEPIRGKPAVKKARHFIISVIAKYVKGDPIRLTAEQVQQVDQRFGPSNARTCDRYFPNRTHLFETES